MSAIVGRFLGTRKSTKTHPDFAPNLSPGRSHTLQEKTMSTKRMKRCAKAMVDYVRESGPAPGGTVHQILGEKVGEKVWEKVQAETPKALTVLRAEVAAMGVGFSNNTYRWVGFPEAARKLASKVWGSAGGRVDAGELPAVVGKTMFANMKAGVGPESVVVELKRAMRAFGIAFKSNAFVVKGPTVVTGGDLFRYVSDAILSYSRWCVEHERVLPVGLDCEGDLGNGNVSLIQLSIRPIRDNPAASSSSSGNPLPGSRWTILLHLAQMDSATRRKALELVSHILTQPQVVVVMHDGRADAIGLAAQDPPTFLADTQLFDLQVAWREVLGKSGDCSLNEVLTACGAPANKHKDAMHARFRSGENVWNSGALDSKAIKYAAADVDGLIQAYYALQAAVSDNRVDVVARSLARLPGVMRQKRVRTLESARLVTGKERAQRTAHGEKTVTGEVVLADGAKEEEAALVNAVCNALPGSCGYTLRKTIAEIQARGGVVIELLMDVGSFVGLRCQGGRPSSAAAPSSSVSDARWWTRLDQCPRLDVRDVRVLERALETLSRAGFERDWTGEEPDGEDASEYEYDYEGGEDMVVVHEIEEYDGREEVWTSDNRMGIGGTLHRISRAQRRGKTTMLTIRVGRHFVGSAKLLLESQIEAVVDSVSASRATESHSILLVGPPCSGKTTLVRDMVSELSTQLGPDVVVVDTSGEIGGSGMAAHGVLGAARRMFVDVREKQYHDLLEAVQNHTPGVIVVDEIRDAREANSVATIAQRGVCVIATAHGNSLSDVVRNKALSDLVGGVTNVILSASEVPRQSSDGRKATRQRSGTSPFATIVEVVGKDEIRVVSDVNGAIDTLLNGDGIEPFLHTIRLAPPMQ